MKKHLQKISALLVLCPSVALAQLDLGQVIKPESGKPINIKSDSMIIRNKENLAIFTENVHVKQGGMTLDSDQLKVYSDYDEKARKNKFKRMEAEGNVNFNSEDKSVQSNRAVYDVIAGTLVLEGNVHMKDADTVLEGKIFKYDVKTGRSEIRKSAARRCARCKSRIRVRYCAPRYYPARYRRFKSG